MKRLRLLVLLVSLLIFWGFGGSSLLPFLGNGVDFDELEYRGDIVRGDIRYLKGSDTPYTGKATSRYPKGYHTTGPTLNSRKRSKGNYKNGKPHGLFVRWWPEGQKSRKVNYKDGKPHGPETQWYETGQKKFEINYKNGRKVGLWNY